MFKSSTSVKITKEYIDTFEMCKMSHEYKRNKLETYLLEYKTTNELL